MQLPSCTPTANAEFDTCSYRHLMLLEMFKLIQIFQSHLRAFRLWSNAGSHTHVSAQPKRTQPEGSLTSHILYISMMYT